MTVVPSIDTLPSPWDATFSRLVEAVTHDMLILSPYVTRGPVDTLVATFKRRHREQTIQFRLVTDLSPASLAAEALDVAALSRLLEDIPKASLTHLPRLHAKVYIADRQCAVITSANMTAGGLSLNYEYGLCLNDPLLVSRVRQEAEAYANLGADVSREALADLSETVEELVSLHREAQREVAPRMKEALRKQSRLAELKLLRVRAAGKTTHGIFADTLMYLLGRGPQRTVELHRMIQRIHPDLCDDSIDRVIDDVHFGRKWKHYVRTAQQHLKRRGMISYSEGRWFRLDKGNF